MAKAKKAKSVAKPKKKGRQPDKAVASDTPRSHLAKCESKSVSVAHDKAVETPSPQEDADCKIERVRYIWHGLSDEDRASLLNVPIQGLIHQAASNALADAEGGMGNGSMSEILVSALERKQEMSTWRVWIWPHGNEVFPCAESLTKFLHDNVLSPSFQQLLPAECLSDVEAEEQEALRLRMRSLLDDVQKDMKDHAEKMNDGAVKATNVRKMRRARLTTDEIVLQTKDRHIDMIIKMAGSLSEEDEFLYQLVAFPINQFLNTTLPDSVRQTRYQMPARPVTAAEVHFDELNSLSPEHVRTVFYWIHEKVESFATALKKPPGQTQGCRGSWPPDAADMFVLSKDQDYICVSTEWKEFLKQQACQTDTEEISSENSSDDLLLQWIYGNVVSEREKARDGAKRALYQGHSPDGQSVYSLLRAALNRQEKLSSSYESGMELLRCILKHRAKVEELVKAFPAMLERAYNKTDSLEERGRACFKEDEFPTAAVIAQLDREQSLTLAKLHILKHRHDQGIATVQKLRQEQRRGEPLFERMRKKFEEAKQAQKGVESCRATSDVDRHRQAAADIAMEEQMQAQYNVRAQGTYLQGLSNRIGECEQENSKQTTEMKQLSQWKHTISRTLGALKEYQDMMDHGLRSTSRQDPVLMAISGSSGISGTGPGPERQNFFETLRRQLYNDRDDHKFYSEVQSSLKELKAKMRDGRAAICHLHQNLISATCDDPCPAIGMLLVLPFIQQRLDGMLEEHAASQAKQAEAELLLDTGTLAQAAVPAKTTKKKKKPKPKSASTKQIDIDASAKAASEAARVKAEEQQRIRLEALERQRLLEDELLEKRKQELMQEEHGFWRQRMEQDKREKELMNTTQTSECRVENADGGDAASPRIGTSNHRHLSSQSPLTEADEVRQKNAAGSSIQTCRDDRVVPHSRRSDGAVVQHTPPCARPGSRGTADAPIANRCPVPQSVRQVSSRHASQNAHVQAASIPARRCDDPQQATHLSNAAQAAQSGPVTTARECEGLSVADNGAVPEPAVMQQAGPGSKSTVRSAEANSRNGCNPSSGKQSHATGPRQGFIATGEVMGVPVHTRAEYTVASTSRTSSSDLHMIPKVEHVSHVNLSTSREGNSGSRPAVADGPRPPNGRNTNAAPLGTRPPCQPTMPAPPQRQPPMKLPAQPPIQPPTKPEAPVVSHPSTVSLRAAQQSECDAHVMVQPPPVQEAVSSATSPPAQPTQGHVIQTSHAQPMTQRARLPAHGHHNSAHVPVPPRGPHPSLPGVAISAAGSRSNDAVTGSGDKMAGSSQSHGTPAQATPVHPVAGPGGYMPMSCTHGAPSSGYPSQHGVQTAVYYTPVSMGIPNGGQQPFYVQHMDGMYMQTHPAHAYGMVYQPTPYQAVMHPVAHFPPGAVPHPQFQGMQWTPAKQLNAQAPAFVPGHAHADAVPSQHHQQMRPPQTGMYHVHPAHLQQQQRAPGQVQSPSSDGAQPGRAQESSRHPSVAGPSGSEAVLASADDRSMTQPDADSAATDSNSSSSTITAEPCCDAVHACCVSKVDAKSVQAPAPNILTEPAAHSRTPLASIRTEAAGNKLRESHSLPSKSPRSPSSSKKRASKKARKIVVQGTSQSLAALENQHEARYKLVGGRVGLRNRFGQNHCFLNVIVQVLWHLKSFSTELLLLDVPRLPGRSSSHSEWRLLSALASLFHEFEASDVTEDSAPTLSPDGLRSALPSAFANEGDMHDAHEVLHEMFSALHFAQAGGGSASVDPTLPLVSFVPEAHVSRPPPASNTAVAETTWARRVGPEDKDIPSSLVIHTFGMRVQVPNPQESPLPGRSAVDRFVRYFHHVNTEPLIITHQEDAARGTAFDWSQAVQTSGFDAGADVPLLSHPRVVTLTIVWHTARPNRRNIQDVCDTMQTAEMLDISKLFTGTKRPTDHHLRCVITYQHLHYIAFVHDESQGWLMLNDSRITKFGEWQRALDFMVDDDLLPIVLFYEI